MSNTDYLRMYEKISKKSRNSLVTSGRYAFSRLNYKKLLACDIGRKLSLNAGDLVLDLGCNIGIYHPYLHQSVKKILGVDGVKEVVDKSSEKYESLGFQYQCFDILETWPELPDKCNKIIVYSVVHFFDSLDDIERLLLQIDKNCDDSYTILLGEVRTKEKYEVFLDKQSKKKYLSFRDLMFKVKKTINSLYLKNTTLPALKPTVYKSKDLLELGFNMGLEVQEFDQDSYHPFYNTCSDFIFIKK